MEKKSGLVAALCAWDAIAVAMSYPHVCVHSSHGALMPYLVSANWAC